MIRDVCRDAVNAALDEWTRVGVSRGDTLAGQRADLLAAAGIEANGAGDSSGACRAEAAAIRARLAAAGLVPPDQNGGPPPLGRGPAAPEPPRLFGPEAA